MSKNILDCSIRKSGAGFQDYYCVFRGIWNMGFLEAFGGWLCVDVW